jgi:hypothetical protein
MVGDRVLSPARQRRGGIKSAAAVTAESPVRPPRTQRPGSSRIGSSFPARTRPWRRNCRASCQFEATGHGYTFHSARARMKNATAKSSWRLPARPPTVRRSLGRGRRRDRLRLSGRGDGPGRRRAPAVRSHCRSGRGERPPGRRHQQRWSTVRTLQVLGARKVRW